MLVSIPFPKRREASRKRKQQSDDRLYKKIRKLENEKRKLQRKCESLRKKTSRSSKKEENSATPNSKTNESMRRVRINPRDAPEIKNSCFLSKLYQVRYGKSEKRGKIINKAFVQWSVARFCGSISLSIMLRKGLILTEENYWKDKPQQIKERIRSKSLQSRD